MRATADRSGPRNIDGNIAGKRSNWHLSPENGLQMEIGLIDSKNTKDRRTHDWRMLYSDLARLLQNTEALTIAKLRIIHFDFRTLKHLN